MKNYKKLIKPQEIPSHVGIIMDGNGRWAQQRSLPRKEGHKHGADRIEPVVECAIDLGIKALSLYAFSVENWTRPVSEIRGLWDLLEYFFVEKIDFIMEKNIQIRHSGSLSKLPPSTKKIIKNTIRDTKDNKSIILNFCINYGGRQEILNAVNTWLEGSGRNEKLTERKLEKHLYTKGIPDLDLMIRTSGEFRISNFMLWQLAYAELVFSDVMWPDFGSEDLYRAVYQYQNRERRYGNI